MSIADKMRNIPKRDIERWVKKEILHDIKQSAKNGNNFLNLSEIAIARYSNGMQRGLFDSLIHSWLTNPENGFKVFISKSEIQIKW